MPFIYYKGGDLDVWEDNTKWCFNADGTGQIPDGGFPWQIRFDNDGNPLPSLYPNYDLALANGVAQPSVLARNTSIGGDITGSCAVNFAPYEAEIPPSISSGNYPCVITLGQQGVTLLGGNYTGSYIFFEKPTILGGYFSGGWISVGSDGNGNTTLSVFGESTPITFKYPTPAVGGGGGGLDVGQLIGLPAFIKL